MDAWSSCVWWIHGRCIDSVIVMQVDRLTSSQSEQWRSFPYLSIDDISLSNCNALSLMVTRSQIHFYPSSLTHSCPVHLPHFPLSVANHICCLWIKGEHRRCPLNDCAAAKARGPASDSLSSCAPSSPRWEGKSKLRISYYLSFDVREEPCDLARPLIYNESC